MKIVLIQAYKFITIFKGLLNYFCESKRNCRLRAHSINSTNRTRKIFRFRKNISKLLVQNVKYLVWNNRVILWILNCRKLYSFARVVLLMSFTYCYFPLHIILSVIGKERKEKKINFTLDTRFCMRMNFHQFCICAAVLNELHREIAFCSHLTNLSLAWRVHARTLRSLRLHFTKFNFILILY